MELEGGLWQKMRKKVFPWSNIHFDWVPYFFLLIMSLPAITIEDLGALKENSQFPECVYLPWCTFLHFFSGLEDFLCFPAGPIEHLMKFYPKWFRINLSIWWLFFLAKSLWKSLLLYYQKRWYEKDLHILCEYRFVYPPGPWTLSSLNLHLSYFW